MNHAHFLIVGASGFIGSRLYARLGPERAVATYHRRAVPGGVYFDVGSMRLSDRILRGDHGITHACLLQGVGKLDDCARDPDGTARVNVEGMKRAIDELAEHGVKILFTSSDAVFDGTRGSWTEHDRTNPIMTYGKQKAAVEQYLAATREPWIVARLSKVVGPDRDTHSLFGEWMNDVENGKPIRCARDLMFTPIHVDDVVTALIRLAEGEFSGIYNVCGPRSMTRLELLDIFLGEVRKYREVGVEVTPCSIRDIPFRETRPLDNSLVPDKLFAALGRIAEDMESVCRRIAHEAYGASKNPKGVAA